MEDDNLRKLMADRMNIAETKRSEATRNRQSLDQWVMASLIAVNGGGVAILSGTENLGWWGLAAVAAFVCGILGALGAGRSASAIHAEQGAIQESMQSLNGLIRQQEYHLNNGKMDKARELDESIQTHFQKNDELLGSDLDHLLPHRAITGSIVMFIAGCLLSIAAVILSPHGAVTEEQAITTDRPTLLENEAQFPTSHDTAAETSAESPELDSANRSSE